VAHVVPDEVLCADSLTDLRDDFVSLAAMVRAIKARLVATLEELDRATEHLDPEARREVVHALKGQICGYDAQLVDLAGLQKTAGAAGTFSLVASLAARKRAHTESLRARYAMSASLLIATEWHSPSINHAMYSSAGRRTGNVRACHDDYKRDRHPEAERFEAAWLNEYVDHNGHHLRAVMTSCGMSAFATILGLLSEEAAGNRPIVMGRSTYHECRLLLERASMPPIVRVDETRVDELWRAVEVHRPRAVFIDSLCNERSLVIPDLDTIMSGLAASPEPVYLVIDNTARSVTFQPWTMLQPAGGCSGLRLITFESITKYAQFGFDRTAAGMVVAQSKDGERLDGWREHLGSNITDAAVHQIPAPNRRLLEARLARLARNATLLAGFLHEHSRKHGFAVGICHPGLENHPSFSVARALRFTGSFFGLRLHSPFDSPGHRRELLEAALDEARRLRVPLVEGTSFGFDTSRIYVTAAGPEHDGAFIRLAAGTEHRLGVEALKHALAAALGRAGGRPSMGRGCSVS
jgi:cystathionine beta-lyase/cystathionine gamma-synthase